MTEILVGRDLHKSFGLTPALQGAGLVLHEGEVVAVTGPSGSGKSTLLHCLAGILTPDAGEVHFAGRRIDGLSDRERVELRRTVFGFQFGQLVPELPAAETVGLRLGELRQVVFLETVAAMLITAAAGVALGVAASHALALFGDLDWSGPDVGVFAMVGAGVLVALVLSATALPVLDAATRHDAVRYE
jgi:ABC-type transporter Mla maintaining outer membrane lipid asymmetry ATPase subunit MlaF